MLNEFVYCPCLAILEWADGEFAQNADTVEGVLRHAAVDKQGHRVRCDSERLRTSRCHTRRPDCAQSLASCLH
jgi:hypothetical protein